MRALAGTAATATRAANRYRVTARAISGRLAVVAIHFVFIARIVTAAPFAAAGWRDCVSGEEITMTSVDAGGLNGE